MVEQVIEFLEEVECDRWIETGEGLRRHGGDCLFEKGQRVSAWLIASWFSGAPTYEWSCGDHFHSIDADDLVHPVPPLKLLGESLDP